MIGGMVKFAGQELNVAWQRELFPTKGPTLNSLLGMVTLNAVPATDCRVKSTEAGKEPTFEHGIPHAPGSVGLGWISGEINA
jgi:hypothetical protein